MNTQIEGYIIFYLSDLGNGEKELKQKFLSKEYKDNFIKKYGDGPYFKLTERDIDTFIREQKEESFKKFVIKERSHEFYVLSNIQACKANMDIKEYLSDLYYDYNLLTMEVTRPPLGLVPKYIRQQQRLVEINDAMGRYLNKQKSIPIEWVEEYNELIGLVTMFI